MTGIHRLQHIQRFAAAYLAYHNTVGAHSQSVDNQLANSHLAAPFHVGRTRFQAHHVALVQLQFR
ncbi:MAG: hypothetical protein BWY63_01581 [Chloroflexi bacterium ADurb.Bin360]|nr:MAG: hypothetical protein BWY63_01581 [Chloroflexi bacterium ADurb.Bin360]